ncbi:MAG TPA: class I SAM-dependent methyltransferase [Bryobacteraceae bacterium]|jgi:SAM-dependent methyltransferase|nr:class I SAM-dependent methyltransferase [Bryobacteraceae bacterium]
MKGVEIHRQEEPSGPTAMLAEPSANYTVADQERMTRANNYFAWQGRLITGELGRRVVEVGAGIGNFTRLLLDREAVFALDIEPACVDRLRNRFAGHPNLQVMAGDAASVVLRDLSRFKPDSCVCINVLEHIQDDQAALENMRSALVPGGIIVLLVPAFPALYGPIDRNLGHCRRYTRQTLTDTARAAGLAVRKMHYVNVAGFFGWWINARILRLEAQSAAQIGLFDRYIVPPMSRIESVWRPPFGQSLFAVLQNS